MVAAGAPRCDGGLLCAHGSLPGGGHGALAISKVAQGVKHPPGAADPTLFTMAPELLDFALPRLQGPSEDMGAVPPPWGHLQALGAQGAKGSVAQTHRK